MGKWCNVVTGGEFRNAEVRIMTLKRFMFTAYGTAGALLCRFHCRMTTSKSLCDKPENYVCHEGICICVCRVQLLLHVHKHDFLRKASSTHVDF